MHFAPAKPRWRPLPVSPAFLISSGVSVSGQSRRLQLALAPETDRVTHVDSGVEAPDDSYPVEFKGMESLMGGTCPSSRVFLGKMSSAEKPSPFWHVEQTDAVEDANMGLAEIAVAVRVSAEIKGISQGRVHAKILSITFLLKSKSRLFSRCLSTAAPLKEETNFATIKKKTEKEKEE